MKNFTFMRVIALVSLAATASFRRGGMAFTAEPTPIEPGSVEPKALLAILTEPRLRVEVSEDGESWATLPQDDLELLTAALADAEARASGADGDTSALDAPRSEVDGALVEPTAKRGAAKG